MKKKSLTGRLALVTAVLCLITMSLTAGTLAKYASSVTGNATATVAKWSIAFKNGDDPYESTTNLVLKPDKTKFVDTKLVADDRIAPEATGAIELKVNGTGTEVAFDYTIEIDTSQITKTGGSAAVAPLKFYSNATCTPEYAIDAVDTSKYQVTGAVLTDAVSTEQTATIYWKWDSSVITTLGTAPGDPTDTALGKAPDTFTIPVTITATQKLTV